MFVSHPCTNQVNENVFLKIEKSLSLIAGEPERVSELLNFAKNIFLSSQVMEKLDKLSDKFENIPSLLANLKTLHLQPNEEMPRSSEKNQIFVLLKGEISVVFSNQGYVEKIKIEEKPDCSNEEPESGFEMSRSASRTFRKSRPNISYFASNDPENRKHFEKQSNPRKISPQKSQRIFLGLKMKNLIDFQNRLLKQKNLEGFAVFNNKKFKSLRRESVNDHKKLSFQNLIHVFSSYRPGSFLGEFYPNDKLKSRTKFVCTQPATFLVFKNKVLSDVLRTEMNRKIEKLRLFCSRLFELEISDFHHQIFLENFVSLSQVE